MKKRIMVLLAVVLLAVALMGAAVRPYTTVWLKPNQTITIICQGDELIITPYSDIEMETTCRVWVGE